MALTSVKVTQPATITGGTVPAGTQVKSAQITVPGQINLTVGLLPGPPGAPGTAGTPGTPGLSATWRGLWLVGTTYTNGPPPDGVLGSNGHWYVSLSSGNVGHDPTTDGGVHWADASTTYHGLSSAALNVTDFSAKCDGKIVTDAAISSTVNPTKLSSTSAAFTSADAGKYVLVKGAGAAASDLITTIVSVAAGVATLNTTAGTTVSGAIAVYGTDDTAGAVAAQRALETAGGGTVYVPGIMIIAGAFVTSPFGGGSTHCAQVPFKTTDNAVYRWVGQYPMNWLNEALDINLHGSLIVAMTAGQTYATAGALPCCFGGADPAGGAGVGRLVMENIGFLLPTNPQVCGLNASRFSSLNLEGFQVFTPDCVGNYQVQPTRPVGIGFIGPTLGNYGNNHYRKVAVNGCYAGATVCELTDGDDISLDSNYIGLSTLATVPHGIRLGFLLANHSHYPIAYNDFTGAGVTSFPNPVPIEIGRLEWEVGGGWQAGAGAGTINDPTNNLYGEIGWWGVSQNITPNGCLNLRFVNLSQRGRMGKQTFLLLAADQSLTSGAQTPLAFTTADGAGVEWDDLGLYPGGASATVLTVPTNAAQNDQNGLYRITWCVEFASGAGTYRAANLTVAGGTSPYTAGSMCPPVSGNKTALSGSWEGRLSQGTTIGIDAYQDSGGALNVERAGFIRTFISVTRLA